MLGHTTCMQTPKPTLDVSGFVRRGRLWLLARHTSAQCQHRITPKALLLHWAHCVNSHQIELPNSAAPVMIVRYPKPRTRTQLRGSGREPIGSIGKPRVPSTPQLNVKAINPATIRYDVRYIEVSPRQSITRDIALQGILNSDKVRTRVDMP